MEKGIFSQMPMITGLMTSGLHVFRILTSYFWHLWQLAANVGHQKVDMWQTFAEQHSKGKNYSKQIFIHLINGLWPVQHQRVNMGQSCRFIQRKNCSKKIHLRNGLWPVQPQRVVMGETLVKEPVAKWPRQNQAPSGWISVLWGRHTYFDTNLRQIMFGWMTVCWYHKSLYVGAKNLSECWTL